MLGSTITIRLSVEKKAMYEVKARAKNLSLNAYLRQKLEENETIAEEIAGLRSVVEHSLSSNNGGGKGQNLNLLLEILLLLRQLAQPHKIQLVQAELKRLGFTAWRAKENDESR